MFALRSSKDIAGSEWACTCNNKAQATSSLDATPQVLGLIIGAGQARVANSQSHRIAPLFMIFMKGDEDCNWMAEVSGDLEAKSFRAQLNSREMSFA